MHGVIKDLLWIFYYPILVHKQKLDNSEETYWLSYQFTEKSCIFNLKD